MYNYNTNTNNLLQLIYNKLIIYIIVNLLIHIFYDTFWNKMSNFVLNLNCQKTFISEKLI